METRNIAQSIVATAMKYRNKLGSNNAVILTADISAWQCGDKKWYKFQFYYDKWESESQDFSEVQMFCGCIDEAIKELREKNGLNVIAHKTELYRQVYDYVWHSYRNEPETVTDGIILYAEPCKEFKSLAKWIEKFTGFKLGMFDMYDVRISGKRGRFFDEDSDRVYTCYWVQKCRGMIDWIIKNRSSRDTMTAEIRTKDECDEEDLRYSIRNETECYGHRRSYLHLEVKTPAGKVKDTLDSTEI
jgi:hypothetical protein